jgi:hypothetical protein
MTPEANGRKTETEVVRKHESSAIRTARFSELLSAPTSRLTPMGHDTAWALKLKAAVDNAVRELNVEVLSAKPVAVFDSSDANDMLFELDTERGRVQAVRSRSGEYTFKWVS